METKPITIEAKGLGIRDFSKFYAEAILDVYLAHRDGKKRLEKQLSVDSGLIVQEVKVHHDGEVHVSFTNGVRLEYTAEELGLADKF